MILYKHRPDLWAISRVLVHCVKGETRPARTAAWEALDPGDQDILKQLAQDQLPTELLGAYP